MARIRATAEETSNSFELAAPGTYPVTLLSYTTKKGANGAYLEWVIQLHDVTNNSEGLPIKGRVGHVFERTTLIEGKRWRLSQMAAAAGLDPQDFDYDELVGKQVTAKIDVEKQTGYDPRNFVDRFLKA